MEVPVEYGGAGMPFFTTVLAIEELAKVDPSVSVVCDVQNTLFTTAFLQWASEEQKQQYLPQIVKNKVRQLVMVGFSMLLLLLVLPHLSLLPSCFHLGLLS